MTAILIPRLNHLQNPHNSFPSSNKSHSSTYGTKPHFNIFNTFPRTKHIFRKKGRLLVFVRTSSSSTPKGESNLNDVIRSVLPGGSWWNLCDEEEKVSTSTHASTVSSTFVLRRIWALLYADRWIVFVAFGSLIVAALSEISIPGLLAASIFSAQSGNNVKRIKETLYLAVLSQDICFFDTEAVGDLTSRLGSDCQKLSHIIGNDIHLISRNMLQGTGALINMLTLSWPLALSSVVVCLVLSAIFLVYGQYQKQAARLTQDFTACANEAAQETFSLIRTVRVNGTESKEIIRYKQWLEKIIFIGTRESIACGFWSMSFNTLYRSTQIFALLLGGMSILTGQTSAEELTKYVLYCEWLIYATWRGGDNMSKFLQSVGASEEVFRLMDLLPCDQFSSKGVKLKRLIGQIEFVDVSFFYASRITVHVLEQVNISLQPNEVVAIVGASGSGKSTLVNLLLRFYEPTRGQILIDGFPLTGLDIRWLREKIGFVGQEPHLFQMDIKSNIAYGCARQIEQGDVEWAAKQANVHDFISSLPDGYNTLVDDNLLSGGQKQRIVIARAFLRDPDILILDEATSALDVESENYITGALRAFKNDNKALKTVIIIAHRLSTIKAADRIIVMDGGRVVEMGNHMDLIIRDGLYVQLIKIQTDALASS